MSVIIDLNYSLDIMGRRNCGDLIMTPRCGIVRSMKITVLICKVAVLWRDSLWDFYLVINTILGTNGLGQEMSILNHHALAMKLPPICKNILVLIQSRPAQKALAMNGTACIAQSVGQYALNVIRLMSPEEGVAFTGIVILTTIVLIKDA